MKNNSAWPSNRQDSLTNISVTRAVQKLGFNSKVDIHNLIAKLRYTIEPSYMYACTVNVRQYLTEESIVVMHYYDNQF